MNTRQALEASLNLWKPEGKMSLSQVFNPLSARDRRSEIDFDHDESSIEGGQRLANEINAYWKARGYEAGARIDREGFDTTMRSGYTVIRSKLVNGLPKDFKMKHKAGA
jgi:hypothetical protein